ncbi:MAG: hypothetical protein L6262_02615 [Weeksellaceae bacterium]|nr:hypothetical protein [Weeksellaceae bacterium]
MITITIHIDNENQINLLQSLFKELNISFVIDKDGDNELKEWQKEKILKGISDISEGKFSTSNSVREKARECFK